MIKALPKTLVHPLGFESGTSRIRDHCSTNEPSRLHVLRRFYAEKLMPHVHIVLSSSMFSFRRLCVSILRGELLIGVSFPWSSDGNSLGPIKNIPSSCYVPSGNQIASRPICGVHFPWISGISNCHLLKPVCTSLAWGIRPHSVVTDRGLSHELSSQLT